MVDGEQRIAYHPCPHSSWYFGTYNTITDTVRFTHVCWKCGRGDDTFDTKVVDPHPIVSHDVRKSMARNWATSLIDRTQRTWYTNEHYGCGDRFVEPPPPPPRPVPATKPPTTKLRLGGERLDIPVGFFSGGVSTQMKQRKSL